MCLLDLEWKMTVSCCFFVAKSLADGSWRLTEREKDVKESFWGNRKVNLLREMQWDCWQH